MSLPTILNSVRIYLNSNYMFVDQDWLTDCVSYLLENNLNEQEIKLQAKEQWMLNNLTDICPGSLPPNIKNAHKIILPTRYVLQINAAVDIGTPAYQQYLKLQKVNTDNIDATTKFEEKVSSNRMIKLYMTDGVQEVTGIEYKPMRNLSLDITPGSKVLIKGPIECRHGILLLTENCIELLGGEVEELVIKNSQASLLSSKLGVPMPQALTLDTTISQPRNVNVPTLHTQMPTMMEMHDDPTNHFADDDLDMDQLDAIEAQYSDNSIKRASDNDLSNPEKKFKVNSVSSTNDYDDYPDQEDMFFEDEEYLREMEANFEAKEAELYAATTKTCITATISNLTPSVSGVTPPVSSITPSISNITSSASKVIPSVSSITPSISNMLSKAPVFNAVSSKLTNITQSNVSNIVEPKLPKTVSSEPFIYIKQINELAIGKTFKVKAQIMKILSKLTVGKDGWSLRCTIVDGTGCLDVDFSSDVLSKLVGFTPQEMTKMKKQMASKPDLKETVVLALQKARDNLQVLYCIIEIIFIEKFVITQLIPFENSHVEALKRRLQDSGR